MDSLSSLSSNLPSNRVSPTEYARMDNSLSTEFKSAAMAVTQLYKLAGAKAQAARDKGYLEAINDIIGILNDGNIDPLKWAWDMRREYNGDDENNSNHPDTDANNDPMSDRHNTSNNNNTSTMDRDGDITVDGPIYSSAALTSAVPSLGGSDNSSTISRAGPIPERVDLIPPTRTTMTPVKSSAFSSTLASTTTPASKVTFSSTFTPVSTTVAASITPMLTSTSTCTPIPTPASTFTTSPTTTTSPTATTTISNIAQSTPTAPSPNKPIYRHRPNLNHPELPLSSGTFTMESSIRYPTMGGGSMNSGGGVSSDSDYDYGHNNNNHDLNEMINVGVNENSKRIMFWKTELAKKAKYAAGPGKWDSEREREREHERSF